jgi:hypothetical protein
MGQPHGTVAALVEPVVANAARKGSRMRTDRWWQSLVVAVVWVAAASGKGLLWVEGEGAARRSVIANAGLDAVDPEELSGGAWLSSFANGDQATGTAFFEVVVPESGVHQLWGRGMGNLACRLDDGEWMVADPKRYSDHLSIAADGNHGYPTVGWFDFGEIELTAGKHRFAWRLGVETGEKRFGTLDCFVLAAEAFQPNGKWKPGEAPSPEPAFLPGQAWDFAPSKDTFDSASLLDLRNLNEEVAGQHGFVRLAADGESFLRGDGQPIRFWAVGLRTSYRAESLSLDEMRRRMRFLAKRGVNLVRIFAMLPPDKPGTPATDVNERELDSVFRLVAACKESGIYTIVCGYWGPHTKRQAGWDLMDSGRDNLGGLVYYDPKTQDAYRSWMRALLDRPNPHTGLRLADDPSVAIVQLQNEDNLLWWDSANTKGEALLTLRRRFAEFLAEKYGSLEQAQAAWQGYAAEFPADEFAAGLPGFLHIWDLTRDGMDKKFALPGFMTRSSDQLEFLARLMRRFNEETIAWLRSEVGCKALTNAGNWQTVDMSATQDAQYWADAASEVMARNAYTGGFHFGVNNGWQILPGHIYQDRSMLLSPEALPTNVRQIAGHPFFLPELLWVQPGLYQAESALVTAGQMSVSGIDAACWFCNFPDAWTAGGGEKWTFSTPMQIGMFPASALMFRKGLLREGPPAVVEHRPLQALWNRATPMSSEDPGFDPNRHTGIPQTAGPAAGIVDPLAPVAGGVKVVFGSDPAQSHATDLDELVDRDRRTVRSVTGEVTLDHATGLYRIDAPQAQGVVGFLQQGSPHRLRDVEIACKAPYAAIVAVALDDRPLRDSARILVQVGTVSRPTGWTTRPARIRRQDQWIPCRRIVSLGGMPWQVGNVQASLAIANPLLDDAVALDPNGMPLETVVETRRTDGRLHLTIPDGILYVLLRVRPGSAEQAAAVPEK